MPTKMTFAGDSTLKMRGKVRKHTSLNERDPVNYHASTFFYATRKETENIYDGSKPPQLCRSLVAASGLV
jgi:hypothetical protein